jgi:hypothetical protein
VPDKPTLRTNTSKVNLSDEEARPPAGQQVPISASEQIVKTEMRLLVSSLLHCVPAHSVSDARQDVSAQYKAPETSSQIVAAATHEVHGDHLVFLNSQG